MARPADHGGGRADNPYCVSCTDAKGTLKSFDEVYQGLVEERFMKLNKMPRDKAEKAARTALSQMPAWKNRVGAH